jgi:CRISPR-associated endonuclease/helicase Cas3
LIGVAIELIQAGAPEDHFIHVCVYHARFPLAQRSAIEHMLDQAFDRKEDEGNALFRLPTIRDAIDRHDERNHIFMVIASPVCEVGRDWDADWAIAEPSSMRSLIQLAGRVQRHRARPVDMPNIHILDRNLRALSKQPGGSNAPGPIFVRPGFERQDDVGMDQRQGGAATIGPFRVKYNNVGRLLAREEYEVLSAIPRIRPQDEAAWRTHERLVDLEQARITAAMLPRELWPASVRPACRSSMERDESAYSWSMPKAAFTGLLNQQQRFREDPQPRVTLAAIPDDDDRLVWHRVEDGPDRTAAYVSDDLRVYRTACNTGPRIDRWGTFDLQQLIGAHAEAFDTDARRSARVVGTVEVPKSDDGWYQSPWFGLWNYRQRP